MGRHLFVLTFLLRPSPPFSFFPPSLQELDLFKAQWLTNYCSENPPSGSNKVRLGQGRGWGGSRVCSLVGALPCPPPSTFPSTSTSPATPRAPTPAQFLVGLFKQPSTVVHDASTATDHTIDPANLAHRIIQIRGDMASSLTKFPK